jgi:DNA-binding CsgD family transcriptional regulator/tetratricopeptide (TPR) repeat protein
MAADLLERDVELTLLGEVLRGATEGRGGTVLISGEAGIGKTTLVRTFAGGTTATARVLVGACDDLLTPRALGPFRDMALDADGLRHAFAAGDREAVLVAILDELSAAPGPNVMIVEDLHWADDATLDAVRFLARRVQGIPAALILTYRDDELTSDHQLQRVLGAFTGDWVRRVHLKPLSLKAVTVLNAEGRLASGDLFGTTGGNPFYVTEVLAAAAGEVPATVRDAVLARLRVLDHGARAALDLLSVIPARVERALAGVLLAEDPSVLDEAEHRGVIMASPSHMWFRHELARRAIEQSLGTSTRIAHNRRVLDALLEAGAEAPRIVHHAVEAQAGEVVAEYAPIAARDAARVGAHREALEHYGRVLALGGILTARQRAVALQATAASLYLLQRYADGAEHGRAAIALWEEIGDTVRLGETLVTHAYNVYWTGDPDGAREAAQRAVELLEPEGPSSELALAYGAAAGVRLMADDPEAVEWGLKAQAVAEGLGREDLVAAALNYVGSIKMSMGDPEGEILLDRALDLTLRMPPHAGAWLACRICANFASKLLRFARIEEAEMYVERGLAIGHEYDLQHGTSRLEAHSATIEIFRGNWDDAEVTLRELIALPRDEGLNDAYVHAGLGRLLARRGDPEAVVHLSRAWTIAEPSGEAARIAGLVVDWLEWAWLNGQALPAAVDVDRARNLAERHHHHEFRGAILRYLARIGADVEPFEECPERFALGIFGRWRDAAALWDRLGNPYESALELLESGEVDPTLDALSILDDLGAEPAAAIARRKLRELGVRRIPRGPQLSTKENPAGLTSRQVEVLAFLVDGLTNAEIAEKLVVSTRTVDHHVSAILSKLGAATRREAAGVAMEMGVGTTDLKRPPSTAAHPTPRAH